MHTGHWTAKRWLTMIVLLIGGITHPAFVGAESSSPEEFPSLQQQIEALQQGQQAIRDELKAIKELLTVRTDTVAPRQIRRAIEKAECQ